MKGIMVLVGTVVLLITSSAFAGQPKYEKDLYECEWGLGYCGTAFADWENDSGDQSVDFNHYALAGAFATGHDTNVNTKNGDSTSKIGSGFALGMGLIVVSGDLEFDDGNGNSVDVGGLGGVANGEANGSAHVGGEIGGVGAEVNASGTIDDEGVSNEVTINLTSDTDTSGSDFTMDVKYDWDGDGEIDYSLNDKKCSITWDINLTYDELVPILSQDTPCLDADELKEANDYIFFFDGADSGIFSLQMNQSACRFKAKTFWMSNDLQLLKSHTNFLEQLDVLGLSKAFVPINFDYYRPQVPGEYPVLFFITGNDLSPDEYRHYGWYLASQGYNVVVVKASDVTTFGSSKEEDAKVIAGLVKWVQNGGDGIQVLGLSSPPSEVVLAGHGYGAHIISTYFKNFNTETDQMDMISKVIMIDPINNDTADNLAITKPASSAADIIKPTLLIGQDFDKGVCDLIGYSTFEGLFTSFNPTEFVGKMTILDSGHPLFLDRLSCLGGLNNLFGICQYGEAYYTQSMTLSTMRMALEGLTWDVIVDSWEAVTPPGYAEFESNM